MEPHDPCQQGSGGDLGQPYRHVLHSAAVGDDYLLDVWLPESYRRLRLRYPVLYVLDSPGAFGLAVRTVMTHVWEGLLPED